MGMVTITIDGRHAHVRSPYDPGRVDVIKSMPDRKWDPNRKLWVVPAGSVDELAELLRGFGDTVVVKGAAPKTGGDTAEVTRLQQENKRLQQELRRVQRESSARSNSWAEHLLGSLTGEARDKAYRRLSSVVHPDVGGSGELQRDLNIAFDQLNGKARRR